MLSNLTKNCQVFFENGLNISRLGDILLLGSRGSYRASHVSVLFSPVFSAKSNENLPSLKNTFALEKEIPPQRIIVSLCLAGRFSVVLRAGSWQDLHYRVRGIVQLFCVWTRLVRKNDTHTPRGRYVPVRLSPQSSFLLSRKSTHPAAFVIFPRQIPENGQTLSLLVSLSLSHIYQ